LRLAPDMVTPKTIDAGTLFAPRMAGIDRIVMQLKQMENPRLP
jgi:hypothetical protein